MLAVMVAFVLHSVIFTAVLLANYRKTVFSSAYFLFIDRKELTLRLIHIEKRNNKEI